MHFILWYAIIGIFSGIITGLTPGLHINTVNQIVKNLSLDSFELSVFIIAMSITHTFLDAIPSLFLGIPDSDSINILPGHQLAKKGKGLLAFKLTLVGSFFAVFFTSLLFIIFIYLTRYLYLYLKPLMFAILLFFVFLNLYLEKNIFQALFVTFLAGVLGIISFNYENSLFPLLTGLFGFSSLIFSVNSKIPEQKNEELILKIPLLFKVLGISFFTGLLTGIFPGISTSQASMLSLIFLKDDKKNHIYNYLILSGSINTFNFMISLFVFHLFNKARNGSVVVLKEILNNINFNVLLYFLLLSIFVASMVYFLGKIIVKHYVNFIMKINYNYFIYFIFGFVTFLVILFSGFYGTLILLSATLLGILTLRINVNRRILMNSLLIPVLFYLL